MLIVIDDKDKYIGGKDKYIGDKIKCVASEQMRPRKLKEAR